MYKNWRIWMLLTVTLLMFVPLAKGQVTIGSDSEPAKTALLDLKTQDNITGGATTSTGGLLLPRVNLVNINSLSPFIAGGGTATDKAVSKGLMVYNLTDNGSFLSGLYTWDGTKWVRMANADEIGSGDGTTVTAANGVIMNTDNQVRLGGELDESTAINTKNYNLDFAQSTGKFNVGSGLAVSDGKTTVGLNSAVINPIALLDVRNSSNTSGATSSVGGIGLPRVTLQAKNSLAPFISGGGSSSQKTSAVGTMVYHIGNSVMEAGTYTWDGTNWVSCITRIPEVPGTRIGHANMIGFLSVTSSGQSSIIGNIMPFGILSGTERYITIPEDGSYAFALRFYSVITPQNNFINNLYYPSIYIQLLNCGSSGSSKDIVDSAELAPPMGGGRSMYGGNDPNIIVAFSTTLGNSFKAGDRVQLAVKYYEKAALDNAPMTVRGVANESIISAHRTSLIYWKL